MCVGVATAVLCVIVDVVGVRCCWGEAKNARKLPKNVTDGVVSLSLFVTKERAKIKISLRVLGKTSSFFFGSGLANAHTGEKLFMQIRHQAVLKGAMSFSMTILVFFHLIKCCGCNSARK